ncbi:hypothetical protein ACQ86N_30800 [Puia sp. P3]|uniref:hypothetical protein n=1 Tax=Puia sp. P3 TaxID=3423952 RepID=UPI003D66B571
MTELGNYLRTYMNVADADMEALSAYFHPTSLRKGEYYLKQGRVCDKLSFHRSGLLRVFAEQGDRK